MQVRTRITDAGVIQERIIVTPDGPPVSSSFVLEVPGYLPSGGEIGSGGSNPQLEADVTQLQTEVSLLQAATGSLESDVATLQVDIGSLQTATGSLESDVSQLQSDMTVAQADITALQAGGGGGGVGYDASYGVFNKLTVPHWQSVPTGKTITYRDNTKGTPLWVLEIVDNPGDPQTWPGPPTDIVFTIPRSAYEVSPGDDYNNAVALANLYNFIWSDPEAAFGPSFPDVQPFLPNITSDLYYNYPYVVKVYPADAPGGSVTYNQARSVDFYDSTGYFQYSNFNAIPSYNLNPGDDTFFTLDILASQTPFEFTLPFDPSSVTCDVIRKRGGGNFDHYPVSNDSIVISVLPSAQQEESADVTVSRSLNWQQDIRMSFTSFEIGVNETKTVTIPFNSGMIFGGSYIGFPLNWYTNKFIVDKALGVGGTLTLTRQQIVRHDNVGPAVLELDEGPSTIHQLGSETTDNYLSYMGTGGSTYFGPLVGDFANLMYKMTFESVGLTEPTLVTVCVYYGHKVLDNDIIKLYIKK